MRNRLFAIAAIVGAMSAPIAAQAQSEMTTGVVRGGTVVINDDDGIAVDQRPAFREYIVRERVPNYVVPDRVVVGSVLPETGVTYYDVPQRFGATPYRYTVVNGETILVEPRSRRIVHGRVDQPRDPLKRKRMCAQTTGQESPARPPLRAGFFLAR